MKPDSPPHVRAGLGWRELGATAPEISTGYASAFDSDRGVTVLSRGGQTWEFDGAVWTLIPTLGAPPVNDLAAYDAARRKVVLLAATTWEYNPEADPPTWMDTGLSGPPTSAAAMAYHRALGRVVLFGGRSAAMNHDDTWIYDGTAWSRLTTSIAPPWTDSPTLIDDPGNRRLLLVGGAHAPYVTWKLQWSSGVPTEVCNTAGDEDSDGLADCADPDCTGRFCDSNGEQCSSGGACICPNVTETNCRDGWDDDCDGDIDCADAECATTSYCGVEASCGDDIDDDGDGVIDCADPGCLGVGYCEPFEQRCGDGNDNDGDGKTDCQDVDCFLAPCPSVSP